MASTIIGIIIIIAFTILMIFLICLMLQEKIEKVIYKIPFITKKVERHKVNKRIKVHLIALFMIKIKEYLWQ